MSYQDCGGDKWPWHASGLPERGFDVVNMPEQDVYELPSRLWWLLDHDPRASRPGGRLCAECGRQEMVRPVPLWTRRGAGIDLQIRHVMLPLCPDCHYLLGVHPKDQEKVLACDEWLYRAMRARGEEGYIGIDVETPSQPIKEMRMRIVYVSTTKTLVKLDCRTSVIVVDRSAKAVQREKITTGLVGDAPTLVVVASGVNRVLQDVVRAKAAKWGCPVVVWAVASGANKLIRKAREVDVDLHNYMPQNFWSGAIGQAAVEALKHLDAWDEPTVERVVARISKEHGSTRTPSAGAIEIALRKRAPELLKQLRQARDGRRVLERGEEQKATSKKAPVTETPTETPTKTSTEASMDELASRLRNPQGCPEYAERNSERAEQTWEEYRQELTDLLRRGKERHRLTTVLWTRDDGEMSLGREVVTIDESTVKV